MDKVYLGDSVYVEADELGRLVLTTENGLPDDPSNIIILEPEVVAAFEEYIQRRIQDMIIRRAERLTFLAPRNEHGAECDHERYTRDRDGGP